MHDSPFREICSEDAQVAHRIVTAGVCTITCYRINPTKNIVQLQSSSSPKRNTLQK